MREMYKRNLKFSGFIGQFFQPQYRRTARGQPSARVNQFATNGLIFGICENPFGTAFHRNLKPCLQQGFGVARGNRRAPLGCSGFVSEDKFHSVSLGKQTDFRVIVTCKLTQHRRVESMLHWQ